jgi:hypothetical protein
MGGKHFHLLFWPPPYFTEAPAFFSREKGDENAPKKPLCAGSF